MSTIPFVIERRIDYHGIWNAGYTVGELFFKTISKEFQSKPSYPAMLSLSSSSLALTVFKRGVTPLTPLRTDAIPFDALREVGVNAFQPRCLMAVYVNSKNKLSVIVASSREAKETLDIAKAFKRLQAMTKIKREEEATQLNSNWIFKQSNNDIGSSNNNSNSNSSSISRTGSLNSNNNSHNRNSNFSSNNSFSTNNNNNVGVAVMDNDSLDGHMPNGVSHLNGHVTDTLAASSNSNNDRDAEVSSIKSRTDSRILSENFRFLDLEHDISFEDDDDDDDDDERNGDVFGEAEMTVLREVGPRINSFSVSVQVDIEGDNSDTLTQGVPELPNKTQENGLASPHIDLTQYSKRRTPSSIPPSGGDHSQINGCKEEPDQGTGSETDHDFRGVASQTEAQGAFTRKRYTKRPGSMGSTNAYRNMAAQRKAKNGNSSPTTPTQGQDPRKNLTVQPISVVSNGDGSGAAVPYQSLYLPRQSTSIHNPSTTVNRPIEDVYKRHHQRQINHPQQQLQHANTWTRRGSNPSRKKRLVVSSGRASLRI